MRRSLNAAVVGAGLCLALVSGEHAAAQTANAAGAGPASTETAALVPGPFKDSRDAQLPRLPATPSPLSKNDAGLYTQIFDLQKGGNWRAADKLIAQLDDKLLMGHVLYQRLMHPTH